MPQSKPQKAALPLFQSEWRAAIHAVKPAVDQQVDHDAYPMAEKEVSAGIGVLSALFVVQRRSMTKRALDGLTLQISSAAEDDITRKCDHSPFAHLSVAINEQQTKQDDRKHQQCPTCIAHQHRHPDPGGVVKRARRSSAFWGVVLHYL